MTATKSDITRLEKPDSGGGAIVIVMGGKRGSGFVCQADVATTRAFCPISQGGWR
jgi:hypothetical protein